MAAFEFNVRFLKLILDELFACRFGTFLYNSEKERRDLVGCCLRPLTRPQDVKSTTVSLWSYVMARRELFLNESYRKGAGIDVSFFASGSPVC